MPINKIEINQKFNSDNVFTLVNLISSAKTFIEDWKVEFWAKIASNLQVHTMGNFFMKSVTLYEQEPKEGKEYNVKSYEPITKGSINKGLLDLSRIFSTTSSNITISLKDTSNLKNVLQQYVDKFVDIGQAKDPNSKAVVQDGKIKVIESVDILYLDKNSIIYIDRENSDYILIKKDNLILKGYCGDTKIESFNYEFIPSYNGKKTIVVQNQFQTISIVRKDGNDYYDTIIEGRVRDLKVAPYVHLGVKEVMEGVFESAVSPFIPFGNMALLNHKTQRQVEALFGYPSMTEIESPCQEPSCVNGKNLCSDEEQAANGGQMYKNCTTCNGTGNVSMQTLWRKFMRKIDPNRTASESGLDIPSVQYHLPPTDALTRTNELWKEALEMAEKAIFVNEKKETGNTQSADAKEKDLQEKYNSLTKSSNVFYNGLEVLLNIIYDDENIVVEKPLSLAVLSDIEVFQLLETISSSSAPQFIKSTHLENFLKRYVSQSNPIVKAVEILRKYDIFLFYTNKELDDIESLGGILKQDKIFHIYSFPILMQMYNENSDWFYSDKLESELFKRIAYKTSGYNEAAVNIKNALNNA